VLSTNQKGAIAETAIIHAATRLGIVVSKPVSESLRYDLIFDVGGRLVRVQCKNARRKGDVLSIPFYSARRTGAGFTKRSYTSDEIDAVAAYSPDVDRCYLLPIEGFSGRSYVQLRLGATRNNQAAGVNWASDYELQALD
jgi:hypothetical protein